MIRRNLGWLLLVLLYSNTAWAESQLNLTKGVTEISQEVYDLHMLVMYICTAIGIIVFGAMFWSMAFHRKSKGVKPATFHESTKVEILWTAIPVIILIAMAWPATKTLIAMENNDDSELTIQITGSQWKWHYEYFGEDIEYYSVLSTPRSQWDNREGNGENKGENYLLEVDKPLVIPINRKVRFLITSDDVIHSWWVPAFAVKQDANPGFINEAWTKVDVPGTYRGQCAELCGKDHGYMPVVVKALPEAEYEAWVNEQKLAAAAAAEAEKQSLSASMSMEELMTLGEQTYTAYCAACHQPTGLGLPPAFPALKGSPVATTGSIAEHIGIIVNGKGAMPNFAKQLSMKQIAAVTTYERNAWDNNTGDMAQASDVNAIVSATESATDTVEEAVDSAKEAMSGAVETVKQAVNDVVEEDATIVLTLDELMAKGEQVYNTSCAACHQANGEGLPPAFPGLKGSPLTTGDVNGHIDIVVNGSKKNPAMAAFGGQLTLQDLAAVITYERNAWGNNTGDLVQAADVKAVVAK